MSPDVTEAQFQAAIVELAEMAGWLVYHVANVRGHLRAGTSVGFPDLYMVRERVLIRECKTERGRLSREQREWIAALESAGQDVGVWRPSNWDEIERTLTRQATGGTA